METILQAGFKDLEVISGRERMNMPLLHFCIARKILNRRILTLLRRQAKMRWMGYSPMQYG